MSARPGALRSSQPAPATAEGRASAAAAGVVAAAVALAVGELPSALAREPVSPVTAVSNEFLDRFAGALKDLAISLFGRNDKVALITGVVITSLAIGAALGAAGARRFSTAAAGFAAFGAIGLWSAITDPRGHATLAWVATVVAVPAGIATLALLLDRNPERRAVARAGRGSRLGVTHPGVTDPGAADRPNPAPVSVRSVDRRSFLVLSGTFAATAAVAGAAGNALRNRISVAAERLSLKLPTPGRRAELPESGLIEVEGVSPYVTPTSDFYRIDTALVVPQVPVDTWSLSIKGMVDEPYELTFAELTSLPAVEEVVTLSCVSNEIGGDLVGNAVWLGVPLADLLERAGVQPGATQIVGRSVDGFTVGFPTEVGLDGRVAMVAVGMNGEPLPARHGYPARLVVAGLYGYVSATKWLTEIELTRFEDFDAYWIPRGWSKEAPVKTQSRIDVPRRGASLSPGSNVVAGVAWAPHTGIEAVEVQVDEGAWLPASLGSAAGPNTWVQWLLDWDATPGEHILRVRATDSTGATQTEERTAPAPNGASGHHFIKVSVGG